jgi:hypothetical protein
VTEVNSVVGSGRVLVYETSSILAGEASGGDYAQNFRNDCVLDTSVRVCDDVEFEGGEPAGWG